MFYVTVNHNQICINNTFLEQESDVGTRKLYCIFTTLLVDKYIYIGYVHIYTYFFNIQCSCEIILINTYKSLIIYMGKFQKIFMEM